MVVCTVVQECSPLNIFTQKLFMVKIIHGQCFKEKFSDNTLFLRLKFVVNQNFQKRKGSNMYFQ